MLNLINKSAVSPMQRWEDIDWMSLEKHMRKLQQRIYHAERDKKNRKVRDYQRLILKSNAALLLSIRKVTQINKGKNTAGIDGFKALTSEERMKLFEKLKKYHVSLHNPSPALRTYIPKKNGKLRPLGIPNIIDRVFQNVIKLALEPQWEARFEMTSYGFRPKRGVHDAIEAIFNKLVPGKKQWIFEGDFEGCFDNLNHDHILNSIDNFPGKGLIKKWLKAGYVDNNVFHKTDAGTPQGGIVSPLLANIALHGLDEAIGTKYRTRMRKGVSTFELESPIASIRYADDFVIVCETKDEAQGMYKKLQPYLKDRGLKLAKSKTKITHINDGFDFLGFNIRRYSKDQGEKLFIKPSKESIKVAKLRIKEVFRNKRNNTITKLVSEANSVIRGYAYHWSKVVSKRIFASMDHYIWTLIYRSMKRIHPRKPYKWIKKQYLKPDKHGQSKDKFIFTDPKSGRQIMKMSWVPIVRHTMIKHDNSPFDKSLENYFENRQIKRFNDKNVLHRQRLAKIQKYLCPMCDRSIIDFEEGLEKHHKTPRIKGGNDEYKNLQLVHISCHIDHHKLFPAKGNIPTEIQMSAAKIRRKKLINSGIWNFIK